MLKLGELLNSCENNANVRVLGYTTYNDHIKDRTDTASGMLWTSRDLLNCDVEKCVYKNGVLTVRIDWAKRLFPTSCQQEEYMVH